MGDDFGGTPNPLNPRGGSFSAGDDLAAEIQNAIFEKERRAEEERRERERVAREKAEEEQRERERAAQEKAEKERREREREEEKQKAAEQKAERERREKEERERARAEEERKKREQREQKETEEQRAREVREREEAAEKARAEAEEKRRLEEEALEAEAEKTEIYLPAPKLTVEIDEEGLPIEEPFVDSAAELFETLELGETENSRREDEVDEAIGPELTEIIEVEEPEESGIVIELPNQEPEARSESQETKEETRLRRTGAVAGSAKEGLGGRSGSVTKESSLGTGPRPASSSDSVMNSVRRRRRGVMRDVRKVGGAERILPNGVMNTPPVMEPLVGLGIVATEGVIKSGTTIGPKSVGGPRGMSVAKGNPNREARRTARDIKDDFNEIDDSGFEGLGVVTNRDGTTPEAAADPTKREMDKVPTVIRKRPRRLRKGYLVAMLMSVLVAMACAVTAVLLLINYGTTDPVAKAVNNIVEGKTWNNLLVEGTIKINLPETLPKVASLDIKLSGALIADTMASSLDTTTEVRFKNGKAYTVELGEAYGANGNLYLNEKGLGAVLKETNGIKSDEQLEEAGEETEVLKAWLEVLGIVDGRWVRIPVNRNSQTAEGLGGNEITCAKKLLEGVKSNTGRLGELYLENEFVVSSTKGQLIEKRRNPVYLVQFDEDRLRGFADGAAGLVPIDEFTKCIGKKDAKFDTGKLISTLASGPEIYAEVDENYNLTRLYGRKDFSTGRSIEVDLNFASPLNMNIGEPDDYMEAEGLLNGDKVPNTEEDKKEETNVHEVIVQGDSSESEAPEVIKVETEEVEPEEVGPDEAEEIPTEEEE